MIHANSFADSLKPDHSTLKQRKVYIQWRKGKKVQLVVGGYAYLLPWTTVVLRCPTRHFRKGHIQWLKDGKPLVNLPNLSLISQGYLKILQVHSSHAGIYTCVAGQAQEHLVLQVIGSKQKLAVPESWLLESGPGKARRPAVSATGDRFKELPISPNRYDKLVQHLLELKGSVHNEKYISDKPQSSENNRSTPEDERASTELFVPVVLTTDSHRLDELMHNLSEGLGGPQGEQLISQFLAELTVTQGETNESTLHPPESTESSTQGPLLYKPSTSRTRKPVIIHWPKKDGVASQSELVVYVGVPVLLQKPVASLELKCKALGDPKPAVTWTKNGKELHPSGR